MHKEVLIYYCLMDKNLLTCACACLDAVNDNVTGSLGENAKYARDKGTCLVTEPPRGKTNNVVSEQV